MVVSPSLPVLGEVYFQPGRRDRHVRENWKDPAAPRRVGVGGVNV